MAQSQSLNPKSAERLAAEEMRWRLRENQTTKHFGFALVVAERGKVVLRMRVGKKHLQVHGVVHGGVLAALADTAGGLAT
jgi:acyl-coenzyme A thioesterase PaaI-like protein